MPSKKQNAARNAAKFANAKGYGRTLPSVKKVVSDIADDMDIRDNVRYYWRGTECPKITTNKEHSELVGIVKSFDKPTPDSVKTKTNRLDAIHNDYIKWAKKHVGESYSVDNMGENNMIAGMPNTTAIMNWMMDVIWLAENKVMEQSNSFGYLQTYVRNDGRQCVNTHTPRISQREYHNEYHNVRKAAFAKMGLSQTEIDELMSKIFHEEAHPDDVD